jgi:hypothetical protein
MIDVNYHGGPGRHVISSRCAVRTHLMIVPCQYQLSQYARVGRPRAHSFTSKSSWHVDLRKRSAQYPELKQAAVQESSRWRHYGPTQPTWTCYRLTSLRQRVQVQFAYRDKGVRPRPGVDSTCDGVLRTHLCTGSARARRRMIKHVKIKWGVWLQVLAADRLAGVEVEHVSGRMPSSLPGLS